MQEEDHARRTATNDVPVLSRISPCVGRTVCLIDNYGPDLEHYTFGTFLQ